MPNFEIVIVKHHNKRKYRTLVKNKDDADSAIGRAVVRAFGKGHSFSRNYNLADGQGDIVYPGPGGRGWSVECGVDIYCANAETHNVPSIFENAPFDQWS